MVSVAGKQLFDRFIELMFVNYEDVESWKIKSNNEIFIRLTDRKEYIFRYISPTNWRIETVKMYEKRMKNH